LIRRKITVVVRLYACGHAKRRLRYYDRQKVIKSQLKHTEVLPQADLRNRRSTTFVCTAGIAFSVQPPVLIRIISIHAVEEVRKFTTRRYICKLDVYMSNSLLIYAIDHKIIPFNRNYHKLEQN